MIRALLIDDERLALLQLEKLLQQFSSIEVVGTFINPAEAVSAAHELKPDVVFLDIDMPELNGMQAAEKLQEISSVSDIVFITAYNEYALEAFEVNALDYVLKPVRRDRLGKTVRRLEERLSNSPAKAVQDQEMVIQCCPSIKIVRSGQPAQSLKWRTTKAQELFALLLHNRNRFVSKDMLIDSLWPDLESKKASTHLYTTIYQVRQCLKQSSVNITINNVSGGEGYALNLNNVVVDYEKWEKTIGKLGALHETNWEQYYQLVESYEGDYLGDYDYMWAENERQRLRTLWLHHAMLAAEFCSHTNRYSNAITIYQRIVHLQPYHEEAHWGLMKSYDHLGERIAVAEQFRKLQQLLHDELGIKPSIPIDEWYKQWQLMYKPG